MTAAKLAYQTRFSVPSQLDSPAASFGHFNPYVHPHEQRLQLQQESTKLNAPVAKVLSNFDVKADQLRQFYDSTTQQIRSLKHSFPELQSHGSVDCPILHAIKNRFPVGITILGQTYRAKCHVVNRLFHDLVISQEAMFDLTEGRMIHFRYGAENHAEIAGPGSYVVLDIILPSGSESDYDSDGSRGGIPSKDLRLVKKRIEVEKERVEESIIRVTLKNQLLHDGASVVVSPSSPIFDCEEFLDYMTSTCLPFIIYAIEHDQLTEQDLNDLVQLQDRLPNSAVLFVRAQDDNIIHELNSSEKLYSQLESIGYLNPKGTRATSWVTRSSRCQLLNSTANFHQHLIPLLRRQARAYLIQASTQLLSMVESCMSKLLGNCLDMSRDLTMTPRKITYAGDQEKVLVEHFRSVTEIDTEQIIIDALEATKKEIEAESIDSILAPFDFDAPNNNFDALVAEIDRLALALVAKHTENKMSAHKLRASDSGPLLRCLSQLEEAVDMKKSEAPSTFLKELLQVGSKYHFKTIDALPTQAVIKRKFKLLITRSCSINGEWIRQHLTNFVDMICPKKLGLSLHRSLRVRILNAHDVFTSSIILLEQKQQARLDKLEKTKSKLRKVACPRLGKLILEASSFRDAIMYGMPRLGKEIGRGQYGVVAEADNWGQRSRVAVKSIVPERECHWGDLAFEFYYTKWWLEPHPHIVKLYGSVIDENYGPGNGLQPAVLLIMERLNRDLYTAIKQGISYLDRIQVTLDVVSGLRYLHSRGLIHRDIKLKNVLLDANNRAKISDLGFCKPGALLSGSVVGTPIHMPPEIFTGSSDTAVDIYALGIMLWYICSGRTRLPKNFESCTSKEDLWTKVRRGARPEYISTFDPKMWTLMQNCWRGNPDERPVLGEVDEDLKLIMKAELRKNQQSHTAPTLPMQNNTTKRPKANRQG